MRPDPEEIRSAIEAYGSERAAARALGIPNSTLRRVLARSIDREAISVPPLVELPAQGFVVKKNAVAYNKDGDLAGQWIQAAAGPGDKFEVLPGHTVKGESALVDPAGRILAKWIKTREGAIGHGLVEALESVFGKYTGTASLVPAPVHLDAELHTIYPLADLHVGMYAWCKETGESYDVDIAAGRVTTAYHSLVGSASPSRTATLLNLGDFFHANDARNVTPDRGQLVSRTVHLENSAHQKRPASRDQLARERRPAGANRAAGAECQAASARRKRVRGDDAVRGVVA